MEQFRSGQRSPLAALGIDPAGEVLLRIDAPGTDSALFGLQGGKMRDEWMLFYNQPQAGAWGRCQGGEYRLQLAQVPGELEELILCTSSDAPLGGRQVRASLGQGSAGVDFDAATSLSTQRAAKLMRLYRHSGEWRLEAVGQGFDGGLDALVRHFGGEVAEDNAPAPAAATPPATPPAAPVSLAKQKQKVLLEKAEREAPQMVSLIKKAAVSLEKRGLGEARYAVKLVLDISGSMHGLYRSGAVQALAEKALALAARLDDDGEVELFLFGVRAQERGNISLSNIPGFIGRLGVKLEGGTNYSPAMKLVRDSARRSEKREPTLVLFITDGAAGDPRPTEQALRDASREPIFWKFMGLREGRTRFDLLEKLDDMSGRAVDNADFFAVDTPIHESDDQLFELLLNELDGWQRAAGAAGILPR